MNCHLEAVVLDFAYMLESPGLFKSWCLGPHHQVIDGQSSQLILTRSWTENHCLQSTGRNARPKGKCLKNTSCYHWCLQSFLLPVFKNVQLPVKYLLKPLCR